MSLQGKKILTELFSLKEDNKDTVNNRKETDRTKPRISEFEDKTDWILTMIIVALMHENPDLSPEKAIEDGLEWARKLGTPNMKYLWRKQAVRINMHGIRAEASKIRRELFKLI